MKMQLRAVVCNDHQPSQRGKQSLFFVLQVESYIKVGLATKNKPGISRATYVTFGDSLVAQALLPVVPCGFRG